MVQFVFWIASSFTDLKICYRRSILQPMQCWFWLKGCRTYWLPREIVSGSDRDTGPYAADRSFYLYDHHQTLASEGLLVLINSVGVIDGLLWNFGNEGPIFCSDERHYWTGSRPRSWRTWESRLSFAPFLIADSEMMAACGSGGFGVNWQLRRRLSL